MTTDHTIPSDQHPNDPAFRESVKQVFQEDLHHLSPAFVSHIDIMQRIIYRVNAVQGFWTSIQDNTASKIALMHSELSEALEADRNGIEPDDKIPDFTNLEAELADTVIRILDFSGRHNLRLGEAITAKLRYNLTRPYRHGQKY